MNPATLKAACNRSHARRRGLERYGLDRAAVAEIEARIRTADGGPDVIMLRPDHRGKDRALFAVRWEGEWVLPVFDTATDSLVTFLPARERAQYGHVIGEPAPEPAPEPDPDPPPIVREPPKVAASDPFGDLPPLPPAVPDDATPADHDAAIAMIGRRWAEVRRRSEKYKRPSDWRGVVLRAELDYLGHLRGEVRRARHEATGRMEPRGVPILSGSPDDLELFAALAAALRSSLAEVGWDAAPAAHVAILDAARDRLRGMRRYDDPDHDDEDTGS